VAAVGALFLLYLVQQGWRRAMRVELTSQGLARMAPVGTGERAHRWVWRDLEELRLHFYPHRRRSLEGTLVLILRAGGARLRLDSSLEHFPTLLLHAASAARERGLKPDATTKANLAQLGL
jgi:hypothetical protein